MRIPKPENKWVVLMSESLKRPTRHHYARTDEVDMSDDFGPEGRQQRSFAFIFRCAETGAERRYGLEAYQVRAKVMP